MNSGEILTGHYVLYRQQILIFSFYISMATVNWKKEIQPLLKKYKGKKHPLEYNSNYELLVMVVLSAQDSDRHINSLAPDLFKAFPDMNALSKADDKSLFQYISKVRNFGNKTKWLLQLAGTIKQDKNIPTTLEALTELPGIGRKSANVILREMGKPAEGIIVDLHVVRVAPRLAIATGTDPKKIEKQLMEAIDKEDWGEAGMAISFLGREICRPTNPKCPECVMNKVCAYYNSQI
jgi:endonuclease-3